MELIFEVLFELILEGCIEGSTNMKVPLIVRVILTCFVVAFFAFVTLGLVFLGIVLTPKNMAGGLFIAGVGFALLVASTFKMIDLYVKRPKQK